MNVKSKIPQFHSLQKPIPPKSAFPLFSKQCLLETYTAEQQFNSQVRNNYNVTQMFMAIY